MKEIINHQRAINENIAKSFTSGSLSIEDICTPEEITKGAEVFTPEMIKLYKNDLTKSFNNKQISAEEFEKAIKDLSRLAMRQIIDKNGHKKTVYVKVAVDEKGNSKSETDFETGHSVKFTKDGKEHVGKIKSLKFHDKTDKVGTAMVEVDGKSHSVSLSKLEHEKTAEEKFDETNIGKRRKEIEDKKTENDNSNKKFNELSEDLQSAIYHMSYRSSDSKDSSKWDDEDFESAFGDEDNSDKMKKFAREFYSKYDVKSESFDTEGKGYTNWLNKMSKDGYTVHPFDAGDDEEHLIAIKTKKPSSNKMSDKPIISSADGKTVISEKQANSSKLSAKEQNNLKGKREEKAIEEFTKEYNENKNTKTFNTALKSLKEMKNPTWHDKLKLQTWKKLIDEDFTKENSDLLEDKKDDVKAIPKGALGLTRNGHAVYENNKKADHKAYEHFTIEDHQDAANLHRQKQAEYQEQWERLSDSTRRTSGTKGYRVHPIDTKRNIHGQRAIEHGFEISRLEREQSKVKKGIDELSIEKAFNKLGSF